jgi:hypothetical protein
MVPKHAKCKELIISFAKDTPNFRALAVSWRTLYFPGFVSKRPWSDLHWNLYIEYIVAKASRRLYFLRVLKGRGIGVNSLIQVFLHVWIRLIL